VFLIIVLLAFILIWRIILENKLTWAESAWEASGLTVGNSIAEKPVLAGGASVPADEPSAEPFLIRLAPAVVETFQTSYIGNHDFDLEHKISMNVFSLLWKQSN